jgi:hypothetical protein
MSLEDSAWSSVSNSAWDFIWTPINYSISASVKYSETALIDTQVWNILSRAIFAHMQNYDIS